jgi:hypothetical protein
MMAMMASAPTVPPRAQEYLAEYAGLVRPQEQLWSCLTALWSMYASYRVRFSPTQDVHAQRVGAAAGKSAVPYPLR